MPNNEILEPFSFTSVTRRKSISISVIHTVLQILIQTTKHNDESRGDISEGYVQFHVIMTKTK